MNSSGLNIMQRIPCIARYGGGEGGFCGHDVVSKGARNGYALALFNVRAWAWVVPAVFVSKVAKAAARCAEIRRIRAVARAGFADYLVSEPGPVEWSVHRAGHVCGMDAQCVTGGRLPLMAWDERGEAGGPLDAPECMPAGGCDELGWLLGGSGGPQMVALRDRCADEPKQEQKREPEPVAAEPEQIGRSTAIWRDWATGRIVVLSSAAFAGFVLASDRVDWGVQDADGPLDAPDWLPVGSCRRHESEIVGVCALPVEVRRAGSGWLQ